METDWELEDWILNEGERAERKRMAEGDNSLSAPERLVREVWILDIETLNGGVSQYFHNNGLARWRELQEAASCCPVPALEPILAKIEQVIAGTEDPYLAALAASPEIEAFYHAHRQSVLAELRICAASV